MSVQYGRTFLRIWYNETVTELYIYIYTRIHIVLRIGTIIHCNTRM